MKKLIYILPLIMLCTSCATQQKILYLQDNIIGQEIQTIEGGAIKLKPNDEISIYVSSENPELATVFNLATVQQNVATNSETNTNKSTLNYTIDNQGNIDFPVLGEITVEGMTKQEVAKEIKNRIISSEMIKDPIVTVNYMNLSFSTLGEVSKPGSYALSKDQTTILEAISMSGDLTINGLRDRVFLTRREEGKLITYQLDLKSKDIYQSPAFYIQQNDIIYVEPNKIRTNQSTVNGNTVRSTSYWMSLASFITSITILIVN